MPPVVWSSVARIIPHQAREGSALAWKRLPRSSWSDGDYVVARVESPQGGAIEAPDGHAVRVVQGDLVVCALGVRRATLEVVGDWRAVDSDRLDTLTRAGVVGRATSVSNWIAPLLVALRYLGHLELGGFPARMSDWALAEPTPGSGPATPAVVLIGTSMSSGKTTAALCIIRRLQALGLTVAGVKLTGVARFSDILAMRDSGAVRVADFVDAGLPSTVAPRDGVVAATDRLLAALDAERPDVLVAEAGASPLEPYQGDAVLERLASRTRLTVLCASDAYAVRGGVDAFGTQPDFVAGRAASTSASVALVSRLSGLEALDTTDPDAWPRIDEFVAHAFGVRDEPADD